MTMEQLAEKLEHGDWINPETGEFVSELAEAMTANEPPLTPDHLPKLARRIIHDMRRLEMIEKFRDDEIARINECCNHRIEALGNQIIYCTDILAMPLVPSSGVELPGLGKFKFRKGREYVDDEAYQKMTQEEQTRVQSQRPGCFKHKTTITPDKTTIKARLEDFADGRSEAEIEGFEIRRHPEVFEFKPEQEV